MTFNHRHSKGSRKLRCALLSNLEWDILLHRWIVSSWYQVFVTSSITKAYDHRASASWKSLNFDCFRLEREKDSSLRFLKQICRKSQIHDADFRKQAWPRWCLEKSWMRIWKRFMFTTKQLKRLWDSRACRDSTLNDECQTLLLSSLRILKINVQEFAESRFDSELSL